MTIAQLILYLFIGSPREREELRVKWKSFCEHHLIDWDKSDEQTRKYLEEQEGGKDDEVDE